MPLHTHNKFLLYRLKKLSAAVALALAWPMSAHAAGFGKLTVRSSLGQPLRAEIELTSVSKEEEGALVARLAPVDAFRKANIDINPVLSSLRFSIEQRQGKQYIRISSAQVINEPFVDLLLELSSGGSRLVREYTFLLDPPDMRKPQTAQAAPAASKPATTSPAATVAPATSSPAPAMTNINNSDEEPTSRIVTKSAPSSRAEELIRNGRSEQSGLSNAPVPAAVAEKTAPIIAEGKVEDMGTIAATPDKRGKAGSAAAKMDGKADGKSYRVKEGDTLAEIAIRNKDNTVSLDQMLVALYRANPDAFIGDNINRLRAGRVLSVPDAATAGAVEKGEARTTVVAQAQDFNAYRNKLASQVANGPSRKARDSRQSGSGKVTARVEEKSSSGEARDKLQLSKAGAGNRAVAEKAAAEDKIAADKALAEANDRVKSLEKNISDLQKLLEIKNKMLADMSEQQKAAAAKEETPASQPAIVATAKPEEKTAETTPADAVPAADAAKLETPAVAPAPVVPAVPKPKVIITSEPPIKASFFDHIQNNPFVLPGAGVVIVLLAGLGFMRVRNNRKKAAAVSADADKEDELVRVAQTPESTPDVPAAATVAAEWAEAAAMGIALDSTNPLYGGSEPEKLVEPEPMVEAAPEEEQGLEFDLNDFKGAEIQSGASPVSNIGSKIDFDLELDSGKTDAEESAATPAAAKPEELPEPVVPSIDLDLPESAKPPKQDVLDDDESAFAAEMSTKLDLAVAYQEIGDLEGARELLEEVMRGGSDSQIERAKDMLSKLT